MKNILIHSLLVFLLAFPVIAADTLDISDLLEDKKAPEKKEATTPASPAKPKAKSEQPKNKTTGNPEYARNQAIRIKAITSYLKRTDDLNSAFLPYEIHSVVWSKDGKQLLISKQNSSMDFSLEILPFHEKYLVKAVRTGVNVVRTLPKEPVPTATALTKKTIRHNTFDGEFLPNGERVVFVGQDPSFSNFKLAAPGMGFGCNLFCIRLQDKQVTPLTNYKASFTRQEGTIFPFLSPDGKKLIWTSVLQKKNGSRIWGERQFHAADLDLSGSTPSLRNQTASPLGLTPHTYSVAFGFSPDGKNIIYAACDSEYQQWFTADLYLQPFDTAKNTVSGKKRKLTTSPSSWDSFPTFSPNGQKIIWASSQGYTVPYLGQNGTQWKSGMVADLWIMNANTSFHNACKLTSFNERGAELFLNRQCFVGISAWHPSGKYIAITLHTPHANKKFMISSALLILELEDTTVN